MFQGGHSLAIKEALNQSVSNTEVGSQPVCFKEDTVTLPCNQSRVFILTCVFRFIYYKLKLTDAMLRITG